MAWRWLLTPIGTQEVTECALVNLRQAKSWIAADRTAFWIASSMLFSEEPATSMIL